ncbi:MAG: exo-alpha-sialidase [candidate division WS1 bacterium]|jgi:hypothetical protein|nr:exo-alpha-sialidase [candidate division WS1 bacterium]
MGLRKVADVTIYRHDDYYASFPSVICRPDGRLVLAFRRAPERRMRAGGCVTHADPNSWLMQVMSDDNALTWCAEPNTIFIHPRAGNQDPCLAQLSDGTLLCSTFAWELMCDGVEELGITGAPKRPNGWFMANLGTCVVRSDDGGLSWTGPYYIDPIPGGQESFPGVPNRGACRGGMVELDDGTVLLPVYGGPTSDGTSWSWLYASCDAGKTWQYRSRIAADAAVDMHEPHLHLTPSGRIVCLIRTANMDGYLAVCDSDDGGKKFSKWQASTVWGHPFTTATVADGRVVVAYGYRREPYGIRCRLTDPELSDLDDTPEVVLRDDGGNSDLGYPWAVRMADDRVLVVYYMNSEDGTRYIAGSILEVD